MAADDTSSATEWRSIPGFEDYEASSRGEIRRVRCSERYSRHKDLPFVIKNIVTPLGYEVVGVEDNENGKRYQRGVHQLVALAFFGAPPSLRHVVAHWDGNKRNNSVSNLRWATRSENEADKIRHGTAQRGEGNPRAVLSSDSVKEIRDAYQGKYGDLTRLAREHGVSVSTVFSVVRRETWISPNVGENT